MQFVKLSETLRQAEGRHGTWRVSYGPGRGWVGSRWSVFFQPKFTRGMLSVSPGHVDLLEALNAAEVAEEERNAEDA